MSGREAAALLLLAACGRAPATAPPPLEATAPSAEPSASASPSSAPEASPVPEGAWPDLVRDEQWDAAWRQLDALPEADRSRPEVRYVRARVALARGDAAAALPLLAGLESLLPVLADDIASHRAEAQLAVGPFLDAAAWFAARSAPSAQLDAARAYEKAGDARRAHAAADRVVGSDKHPRALEAEARALRIRTATPPGDGEKADARWLALQGADLPAAKDAIEELAKVDPGRPLLAREWLTRARTLSDAGHTDEALHAIDLSGVAADASTVTNLERARAKGMALYHARGRYLEAHKVLTECAGAGGATAAEDAFHAARALSRADRDDDAIKGYEDVERRFPKSTWATQAAFYVPYLKMLHGEWKDCAHGFGAYLKAHAGGDNAADARRDGALCTLLSGDARSARVAFEHLVEDEPDPVVSARMANLAALAALQDGDKSHALARWTDVARSRPLTWPAGVARARLAAAGAPLPPVMDPPESGDAPPPLAVSLPPPVDLLHAIGLEADAEAALREREALVTRGAGSRATEALCTAYGQLARARRRFQIAQGLPSSLLAAAPGPRSRWAWECAFPGPYAGPVHAAESADGLPSGLIWAVARQESGFEPSAVSPARAVGLMQLLPETARPIADALGLPKDDARLTSPPYAVRVGSRALAQHLEHFHGQIPLAVAAYNGGEESVDRWLSRAPGMQIDTFVERIPFKETRDYVSRVMGNLFRYEMLAGGEAGVAPVQLELTRK